MRFFNFKTRDEMEFVDSKLLAYFMRLEQSQLKGTLETYSLPLNDVGIVMINHKVPSKTLPISGRTLYKCYLGLVLPGKEYGERAKAYIMTIEEGRNDIALWNEYNTPGLAVRELKALYGAESTGDMHNKIRAFRNSKKDSFEFYD